ncbi:tetratricopeptide repeat protein [Candidatus Dependentiae bacterium]|nr:tetratricopeptide repeat protein [Candidatus Dependentiae bacterium]
MKGTENIDKFLEKGDYDTAIKLLKKQITDHPDYPDLYNKLAIYLLIMGKMDEAIKVLLSSLKFNPEYLDARLNLILIYIEQKKFEEAKNHLIYMKDKLETSDFKNLLKRMAECKTFVDQADIHEEIGMYNEAIDEYIMAIDIMPNFADIHFKLAKIYAEIGAYDFAFKAFSRALQINPKFEKARIQRGILYYKRGMIKAASEEWKMVLKYNPDSKKANSFLKILNDSKIE